MEFTPNRPAGERPLAIRRKLDNRVDALTQRKALAAMSHLGGLILDSLDSGP
jgi:hypothetical protein